MMFKGARFTTNRWGMRDRDYEKQKPSGVYRIGIIGGSYGMGPGVEGHQTFEQLAEDRLNQETPGSDTRYEVLNFSVGGYFPIHRLAAVVDGRAAGLRSRRLDLPRAREREGLRRSAA